MPNWIYASLYPLLSGDEVKLHGYIVYLTWGMRLRSVRLSRREMLTGMVWGGERIDLGTGLTTKGLQRALGSLIEYGVLFVAGRWSWEKNLPYELRPGWQDEINYDGLRARMAEKEAKNAKRASNLGVTATMAGERLVAASVESHEDRWAFEEEFSIVPRVGNFEATTGGSVGKRQDRIREKLNIPAFIKDGSFPLEEWHAITDVFLHLTGQYELAMQNDESMVHLADKALAEAHDVANVAIVSGIKTAVALNAFPAYWRNTWQYKKAQAGGIQDPTPTMNQLKGIVVQYAKENGRPVRAQPATNGAAMIDDTFYVSELGKPKRAPKKG